MSARPCPGLADLAAFVSGDGAPGVATHVDACDPCSRRVAVARRALEANLTSAAVAAAGEEIEALLGELLARPQKERERLALKDRFARAALAHRFCSLATSEWERDLNAALDHIHVATIIASRLASRGERAAELEFEAWKHRSTIHRKRGECDAARAALTRAAAAIDHCTDRELKRAVVAYADAAICASRDVWEPQQAIALLMRCEAVFRRRDPSRHRDARTLRGIVHLHAGEYEDAHRIFSAVAADTDPIDESAYADAHRNLANSLIRLGRLDEADQLLKVTRALDDRLKRSLHVVRDDALAAIALDVAGRYAAAADAYQQVGKRFIAAGERESGLLAGVASAVALVAASRPAEARIVLQGLLTTDVASSSERRRFTAEALAYLRELAEREQLTPDVATGVGLYIDRIHVQRARPFVPPMSPLTM